MINFNRMSVLGSVSNKTPITAASTFGTTGSDLGTEFTSSLLEGLVDKSPNTLYNIYREIYALDTISGPAVDLMSTLPWSDFVIQGVEDPKILKIYEDTMEELNTIPTMTNLATTYLVLGNIIGSLLFDSKRGIFTDIIIQDPNYAEIIPIPLIGYDPKINIKITGEFKKFLTSKDPRDEEARKEISPELMTKLQSGKLELEPLSTLYLQRLSLPGTKPISYYTRILPIWLVEKALIRGTIIAAWRRQRSVLWVKVGEDDWEPTDEQLAQVSQLFQNADRDPQGAVVTTRNGIEAQEIRNGSDFWKLSDEYDTFANAKMRALGISEAFLSGESSYNTAEVALSVFMENLRSFRDTLTKAVWTDKVFLLLAKYHGFKKRTKAEISHRLRLTDSERNRDPYGVKKPLYASRNTAEAAQYEIPTIHWSKELKASGDFSIIDLLDKAKEYNIPVPMSILATACGLNIDSVINGFQEDVKVREKIKAQLDLLKKQKLDFAPSEDAMMMGSTSLYKSPQIIMSSSESGASKFDKIVASLASSLPSDVILDKRKAKQLLDYALKLSKGRS